MCDFDADIDNVNDSVDKCIYTPIGDKVDAEGCSVGPICPCIGNWMSRTAYVRCVAQTGHKFYTDGVLTAYERSLLLEEAAKSNTCGQKQ